MEKYFFGGINIDISKLNSMISAKSIVNDGNGVMIESDDDYFKMYKAVQQCINPNKSDVEILKDALISKGIISNNDVLAAMGI